MTERGWRIGVATVVTFSIAAHLWKLGLRPLAHDEAIDAAFSWQARTGAVIRYDPVYHGPLRFYLEGPILGIFGTTAGWARTVAAVSGIAGTALIASFRRVLGSTGSLVAAVLWTISPTVLTVTRTGREDSLVALVSVAMMLTVADALIRPSRGHVLAMGVLVAISLSLKETTFLFGLAGALFFIALAVAARRHPDGPARRFWAAVARLGWRTWVVATVGFVAVFAFVFTSAFRYPEGFTSGLVDGVRYWWSQHEVRRGGQPWFFYLTVLGAYEWLILGLAAVGVTVAVRRRSIVGAWFASMSAVQLALYSWAGEKFPWLAIHPLIPMVLLAGWAGQACADRMTGATHRRLLVVGGAAAALGTILIAVPPAITRGADPSELLVAVHTTEAVPDIADRLVAAAGEGTVSSIFVDTRDGGAWPWGWYLEPLQDVTYEVFDPDEPLPSGYDAYIVNASDAPPEVPEGFVAERFAQRGYWQPDYNTAGAGDLADWLLTRRTWNPTGTTNQYLIVRPLTLRPGLDGS
ncbi:MAG: TIGR03663 family protein [Microthrixaceae bacterium]